MADDLSVVTARIVRKCVIGRPRVVAAAIQTKSVVFVEMMIDAKVQLIPVDVGSKSKRILGAVCPANPSVVDHIETVVSGEVVGQRHCGNNLLDQSGWIEPRTEGIPGSEDAIHVAAENVER